ncbi:histone H1A, sperm-like [Centruroides sculpturatus]|uniref:histone H1A, sperm-like n=1 Tax=Centruroides sculpturatus TaxID=218467 RepID=UPI000C6E3172|nr:histone H1A, sperm-like [Centruroides sculpturatus]
MSETVAMESVASTKKKASRQRSKSKSNHPKISQMVNTAIVDLKDRGGSSLQAIKKYIASNYKVDVEKLAPFIRKHLKMAVVDGSLIQTKGKGASGSFKVGASGKKTESKSVQKVAPKKPSTKSKPKVNKAKKVAVKSKPKAASKAKKVTKVKVKKSPAKAKAPRPKKTMKKGSQSSKKAPKQSKVASKE